MSHDVVTLHCNTMCCCPGYCAVQPPNDKELTFHGAVYWAAVTVTTAGYGECKVA